MNSVSAIMLIITIITGPDHKDKQYRIPQPTVQVCLDQANEFLHLPKSKLPADMIEDMQGRMAGCAVKEGTEEDS